MPASKKKWEEKNDALPENASPVCYINAAELRPEFKEALNETIKTQVDNDGEKKHHKPE